MSKQIQQSKATFFNRYAEVFQVLREAVRHTFGSDLGGGALRILSFGCSNGVEMLTARAYFPDATILGCDTDSDVLRKAVRTLRDDDGQVFVSTPEAVRQHGPYDVILANSVLCSYPIPGNLTTLSEKFPFSQFSDLGEMLIEALVSGGWFVLYNSSYSFRHLPGAGAFNAVESPMIEANGFADKFAPDGTRLTRVDTVSGQRAYDHCLLESGLTDQDLRNVIWTRGSPPPVWPLTNPVATKGAFVLGRNPVPLLAEGRIAAGLYAERFDTPSGPSLRREWRKGTIDGEIAHLGSWDTRAGPPLAENGWFTPAHRRRGYWNTIKSLFNLRDNGPT